MDKLYWLEQIQETGDGQNSVHSVYRSIVGERVLNLAKVAQLGYRTAPSLVIGADLWREFIEPLTSSETLVADLPHSSLHLDVNNWRQLQQVANRLCHAVMNATIPNAWIESIGDAVQQWQSRCLILRPLLVLPNQIQESGAIARLFDVDGCVCREDAIANTLKQVWSQVFRATSLLYWQRAGIDLSQVGMAVLVQPLDDVVVSGILTVNPQMWEVQATWGLGLAITRGDVIPDIDKINPQQGRVIERKLGHKTVADWVLTNPEQQDQYQTRTITPLTDDTWMATCILEESQQQQFALSPTNQEQLIAIAQGLSENFHQTFTLEWSITSTNSGQNLLLTNVTIPPTETKSTVKQFYGLAAAGGQVWGKAYVIVDLADKPESLPSGSILVAPSIVAQLLPLLSNFVGIITEQGGLTSHAAILARELRIPAVVRVANATQRIQTGDNLLIDGDKGEVSCDRNVNLNHTQIDFEPHRNHLDHSQTTHRPHNLSALPVLPPISTKLFVNLSQTQSAEGVQLYPIDGIGLLRSELMGIPLLEGRNFSEWLNHNHHKSLLLERWCECLSQFTRTFAPRPVFYRTYDGHYQNRQKPDQETTFLDPPPLGYGTLNYLDNPELLEFELTAIAQVQQAGNSNLNLILPFVRTVEEFTYCRDKAIAAGLTNTHQFQLWIMAEVPSVLFLLPEYVRAGVQGIAIGTNDLTRLILAVERDTAISTPDARHPAVMRAIEQLIVTTKNMGIPCSICGYAASQYPEIIDDLVRWGITAISVEPDAIEKTYQAIARAEHRLILENTRQHLNH